MVSATDVIPVFDAFQFSVNFISGRYPFLQLHEQKQT
jgi:hypothetical protein